MIANKSIIYLLKYNIMVDTLIDAWSFTIDSSSMLTFKPLVHPSNYPAAMTSMKNTFAALLMLIFAACGGESAEYADSAAAEEPMEEAAEPYTGPNAELIAEFDASTVVLMAAIEGADGDRWTFRESDDRWSIAEVVEHLVLAERGLVHGFVAGLVSGEPNAENTGGYEESDDGVRMFIRDRSTKFVTNEAAEPQGIYATPEEAMADFDGVRAQTIEWLKTTDVDFRLYSGTPNPEIDPMDAYQWLIFIAGHTERHSAQIDQVKADANYPAV